MNDTTTARTKTQIQIWFSTRAAFLHSSCLASKIIWWRILSARILLVLFLSSGTWSWLLPLFDWLLIFMSLATRVSLSFTEKKKVNFLILPWRNYNDRVTLAITILEFWEIMPLVAGIKCMSQLFLHWDEFPSIKCHFGQLRVNKELTEGKSVFHNHVS